MKKFNSILSKSITIGLGILLIACGKTNSAKQAENKDDHDHSKMEMSASHDMNEHSMTATEPNAVTVLINDYLMIKNALVNDDQQAAAAAGNKLADATKTIEIASFPEADRQEIKDILEVITEHGEHISKSEIDHQREHFESMGKDIKDLIMTVGTDRTLYEIYCPMFHNGKGGIWLSEFSEIKNPLLGSKMLTCGSVKNTINP